MKLTTLCGLAGATQAMTLPTFDSSNFAHNDLVKNMLDSSNQLMSANSPGVVTYSDCEDEVGLFHFDHEKSHNSEIKKGQDVDIHLRGTVDSQIIAENVHIRVAWNGATLY